MLKVICGDTLKPKYPWLRGKIFDEYSYDLKRETLDDPIVQDELREVDKIVDVNGFCLTKNDGTVIPPQWLCQGTRQFIMMAQNNNLICDSVFFGMNVYPFFSRWAEERNVDVYMITSALGEGLYKDMKGICLNTGDYFNNGMEMQDLVIDNRKTVLDDMDENGRIWARHVCNDDENNVIMCGKPFYIETGLKLNNGKLVMNERMRPCR